MNYKTTFDDFMGNPENWDRRKNHLKRKIYSVLKIRAAKAPPTYSFLENYSGVSLDAVKKQPVLSFLKKHKVEIMLNLSFLITSSMIVWFLWKLYLCMQGSAIVQDNWCLF